MNAKNQLVFMALGPDRVGWVAKVTGYIRERGGNVEDSHMAALGSEFGVMILVSASEADVARLEADVDTLTALGMHVVVRRTAQRQDGSKPARVSVTAEAIDHEGIVYAVSAALDRLGVNIVSLQTECYPAPLSGAPLFRLRAVVDLPRAMDVDSVRKGVAGVAESEKLEIDVRPLNATV